MPFGNVTCAPYSGGYPTGYGNFKLNSGEPIETFFDGEEKTLCGLRVQLLLTPGHTAGSACYLVTDGEERILLTGDTLFSGSIGRTDFPTGSIAQMRASLKKLAELNGNFPVYAGHNEPTTLDTERKTNPFMLDA